MEITLTERAIPVVKEAIEGESARLKKDFFLRLKIMGGGCSGFKQGLELDFEIDAKIDRIFEDPAWGFRVVVDKMSLALLKGAEIDYETKGLNSGFVVNNPNSKGSCGCGGSHKF